MAITTEQMLKRKKYICSSDVSSILGLNPFGHGAWDVWCEKMYDMEPKPDNDNMLFGRLMEPVLAEYAKEETGIPFDTRPEFLEYELGHHLSHPDGSFFGVATKRNTGLECKLSRLGMWGKDEDQIPDYVYCQIMHQCMVCGFDDVVVPAMLKRHDEWIKIYTIPRDNEVIAMMTEELDAWWERYIVGKEEPKKDDTPLPASDTLRRIIRLPKTLTDQEVSLDLIERWDAAKKLTKEAEKAEEALKNEIIALLGKCEGAQLSDGRVFAYMTESAGRKINGEMLQKTYPDVYQAVSYDSFRKVPRIKKVK